MCESDYLAKLSFDGDDDKLMRGMHVGMVYSVLSLCKHRAMKV